MKSPADKLAARANDIIQIEVTRACDLWACSNCTRLLPFRRDTLHMSPEVFRRAVESVADWPGVVAMFGGNPCVHPQFEELVAILVELVPEKHRRGLWTNGFRGHGELCARVFGRFNLNPHGDRAAAEEMRRHVKILNGSDTRPSWHAPILLDWREEGWTEEEWIEARERCDINQKWSAAIVERDGAPVAYHCEVAAALDGVTGRANGTPAVAGWWRRDFPAEQIAGCCDAGCGVPLRRRGHLDTDAVYDMSPGWVEAAGEARGKVRVSTEPQPGCAEATDYLGVRGSRA